MARMSRALIFGLVLTSGPVFAADMDFTAPPAPDVSFIQETNGWYLRGDVGVSFASQPDLNFDPNALGTVPPPTNASVILGSSATRAEFDAGGGVGYRFNQHFRTDATFDFRMGSTLHAVTPGIVCPYEAMGLTQNVATARIPAGTPLGIFYNPNETCNGYTTVKQKNYLALANGYYDIATFHGFTPYVGAGVGFNEQQTSGSLTFNETSNGQPYAANLTMPSGQVPRWVTLNGTALAPQPNIAFAPQNWNRSFTKTNVNFAWALMAGVSYKITSELSLDLGYRYASLGSTIVGINPQTGATISQRNTEQDVRLGVRLTVD